MRGLFRNILYVFSFEFLSDASAKYDDWRVRVFWGTLVGGFALLFAAIVLFNLPSYWWPPLRQANLLLSIGVSVLILYGASHSAILKLVGVAGAGAGVISSKATMAEDVEKALGMYARAVFTVLVWLTLILTIAGVFPLAYNIGGILPAFAGLLLLTYICVAFGYKMKYAKTLMYLFAVSLIFVNLALLAPRAMYVNLFGVYPPDKFAWNDTDEALDQANKAKQKYQDDQDAAWLTEKTKQIAKQGFGSLLPEEKKRFEDLEKARAEKKVTAQVASLFKSKDENNKDGSRTDKCIDRYKFTDNGEVWGTSWVQKGTRFVVRIRGGVHPAVKRIVSAKETVDIADGYSPPEVT